MIQACDVQSLINQALRLSVTRILRNAHNILMGIDTRYCVFTFFTNTNSQAPAPVSFRVNELFQ